MEPLPGDGRESETFNFIVGKDYSFQEFCVPKKAFTRLSNYFRGLMESDWKEAKQGWVRWEHMEPSTFRRLCQFAYTGDVDALPVPRRVVANDSVQAECLLDWYYRTEIEGVKKNVVKSNTPLQLYTSAACGPHAAAYEGFVAANACVVRWATGATVKLPSYVASDASREYATSLIANAELYAAAEYYQIQELAGLTFHRFMSTLCVLNYRKNLADLRALVEFVCTQTDLPQRPGDRLWMHLGIFVKAVMPRLERVEEDEIIDILQEFPELAVCVCVSSARFAR